MEQQDLRAGTFSSWLVQVEQAQADDAGASVPCGTCTACCTSSQFIHVGPDEVETLTRIPSALLFPAPGRPRGHVLLGYDERGHCPLFADGRCSIYEHRPRTCRAYDCRVLPAAGVEPDEPEQAGIAERTRRWRFDLPTADDRILHQAVQAAAAFLRDHAAELPPAPCRGTRPSWPSSPSRSTTRSSNVRPGQACSVWSTRLLPPWRPPWTGPGRSPPGEAGRP